jgi:plasmid stability protein
MAVARLDILGRGSLPTLPAPERNFPVKLEPVAFADEIELILPAGFAAEEVPASTAFASDYGSSQTDFKIEGQKLTVIRRVEIKPQIVPAAEYPKLKKFLSDLGKADRAAILLRTGI